MARPSAGSRVASSLCEEANSSFVYTPAVAPLDDLFHVAGFDLSLVFYCFFTSYFYNFCICMLTCFSGTIIKFISYNTDESSGETQALEPRKPSGCRVSPRHKLHSEQMFSLMTNKLGALQDLNINVHTEQHINTCWLFVYKYWGSCMTRGDSGSQGDDSGVEKEWRSEEDALVCIFKTASRTLKLNIGFVIIT